MNKNDFDYTQIDEKAEKLWEIYKNLDPFPDIQPSLLNSADIVDYVLKTGLICPFNYKNLKSASYEMSIGGEVIYWDQKGKIKHIKSLEKEKEITFFKNSITYVTTDCTFRLPFYIALRFNFQIEHVHRGLILGTGPLINPGFHGNLMIPVHNFTENDYKIMYDDPLIGVEFTKISPSRLWNKILKVKNEQKGEYIENKTKRDDHDFKDYLKDSLPLGYNVRSSLTSTLLSANEQILKSEEQIKKFKLFKERLYRISIIAIIGVIIALLGIFYMTWQVVNDANKYVADACLVFKEDSSGNKLYLKSIDKVDEINNKIKNINTGYKKIHDIIIPLKSEHDKDKNEQPKKLYSIITTKIDSILNTKNINQKKDSLVK